MNTRSRILTLVAVAGLGMTAGCDGSAERLSQDGGTSPPTTSRGQPSAGGSAGGSPSMRALEPEVCQPRGPDGESAALPVPAGWQQYTDRHSCSWTAPDGMDSVTVTNAGQEQTGLHAVRQAKESAPGEIAGYEHLALRVDSVDGITVVFWEYLGEDVVTLHFANYYHLGWRVSVMVEEESWGTEGQPIFDQFVAEFTTAG